MSKFKVGQTWITRDDRVATIMQVSPSSMTVTYGGGTFHISPDGFYFGGTRTHGNDLITLLMDVIRVSECPPQPVVKRDLTLREFQTNLPWTIRYSNDFRSSPMTHKDFAHTMHHVSKAAGHLHALADDMDHDREIADDGTLRERYAKYVADLVVCALRLANTFPGGVIDLQAAVHARIENKNNVTLPTKE